MPLQSLPRSFAQFLLLSRLGRGERGELYVAARDGEHERVLCVVKVLEPAIGEPAEPPAPRLAHPNLVRVLDAGSFLGERFVAMELLAGRDLSTLVARLAGRDRKLDVPLALRIVRDVAAGMAEAHAQGVVHGAVDPSQILLSWSGEVKLLGCGVARPADTASSYASPERADGLAPDASSDVWALSMILWELVAGRALHPEHFDPEVRRAALRAPKVLPPSLHRDGVPPWLDELLLSALAPARAARSPTAAAALRDQLDREIARLPHPATEATVALALVEMWGEEPVREVEEYDRLLRETERVERESTRRMPPGAGPPAPMRALSPEMVVVPGRRSSPERVLHTEASFGSPAHGLAQVDPEPTRRAKPESDASAYLGQVVGGRYRLVELLGQGGMGWVYEAEHVEIGKRVALKILLPQFSQSADLVERFRSEARAASKIGHPNIVDVMDFGTTAGGNFYLVMERLYGTDLADTLRHDGHVGIERAIQICIQVCRALAAAHGAGIIHRDLKPENIFLVQKDGNADFVKVLDFGIAKTAGEGGPRRLTTPGLAMGTPEYMAPEQAAGNAADPRVDVYAVGAILYELVTGTPPHAGQNVLEVLTKKATEEPRPAREFNPDVPEVLEHVITWALARDPDQRIQSMTALEYELTKCLKGRGSAVAAVLGLRSTENSWSGEAVDLRAMTGSAPPPGVEEAHLEEMELATTGDYTTASAAAVRRAAPPPVRPGSGLEVASTAEETITSEHMSPGALRPRRWRWLGAAAFAALVGAAAYLWLTRPEAQLPSTSAGVARATTTAPVVPAAAPRKATKSAAPAVAPPAPVVPDVSVVQPLVDWARRTADAGRWVAPPGDNLKELLGRIAAVQADHPEIAALRDQARATLEKQGKAELRKRNYDKAEGIYRAAMEFSPDDEAPRKKLCDTLIARAKLSLSRRRTAAALADAVAATQLLPEDVGARIVLGDAYFAAGRRDQAVTEWKAVLEQAPGRKDFVRRLAVAQKPVKKAANKRRR